MGTIPHNAIAEALFTKTQQRVLSILFGHPDRSYYVKEIVRLADAGVGAVQRELQALLRSGLVTTHRIGNQLHYQANADSPVFAELKGLVVKTFGVADVLRVAIVPLTDRLVYACIYGSVAKGTDTAASDIDVLLIGEAITLEDALVALGPAERQLGRKVNPTLYTSDEFRRRKKAGQAFVTKVMTGPRIDLYGRLDGEG